MNINEVVSFEKMSKLKLPDDERQCVCDLASKLEESFALIDKIDTNGVEPLVSVLNMTNVLREDKAVKMMSREEVLANAPEQTDGYFQVPKTLE